VAALKINREFERRGPLYVPRYDVERVRPFDRYKNRHRPKAAFVQGASGTFTSATSQTTSFPSNNTAGNLLLAQFACAGTGSISISDTNGNNWIQLYQTTSFAGGQIEAAWYAVNCKGGANAVTVGGSGVTLAGVAVVEESGVNALDSVSAFTLQGAGSTSFVTPTITLNYGGEALYAFFGASQGISSVVSPFAMEAGIGISGTEYHAITRDGSGMVGPGTGNAGITGPNGSTTYYGLIASFCLLLDDSDTDRRPNPAPIDPTVTVW
jgi:hypothetical protein